MYGCHLQNPEIWFPCFFLVAKTAIGKGCVIGTIIPQYETEELIAEGLKVISSWNPGWCPDFFMTDKSAQELSKLNAHIYLRIGVCTASESVIM